MRDGSQLIEFDFHRNRLDSETRKALLAKGGRSDQARATVYQKHRSPQSRKTSRKLVFSELYEASKQTKNPWVFEPEYPGKSRIFDGRTGDPFEQPVRVGVAQKVLRYFPITPRLQRFEVYYYHIHYLNIHYINRSTLNKIEKIKRKKERVNNIEAFIFVLILVVGLVYAWRKGALEWS